MSKQSIVSHLWGYERILEANDKYVLKILEVDAGSRLSLQHHDRQRLTLYCLYGHGTLFTTNKQRDGEKSLLPGRYETIEPGTIHRLEASKTAPCIVMQVSCPTKDDTTILEAAQRFYNPYDLPQN